MGTCVTMGMLNPDGATPKGAAGFETPNGPLGIMFYIGCVLGNCHYCGAP